MSRASPRPALALLAGLLALGAPHRTARAQALDLQVIPIEGCPAEAWFRAELLRSNLQGAVKISLDRHENGEFYGEISFPRGLNVAPRRLSGPLCQTVADGLILIAGVHLLPPPPASPPAPPAPPPPPASTPLRLALGAAFHGDSSLPQTLALGAGAGVWLSPSSRRLRGMMLQGLYSRASVDAIVPVRLDHLRARLDLIPWDTSLGSSFALGFGPHLAGGALRAEASLPSRTPDARSLWSVGLSSRLRADTGPLWIDLDLAASLSLTRRRFEITGLDQPLFSLPSWSLAASLSVWVPLTPGSK